MYTCVHSLYVPVYFTYGWKMMDKHLMKKLSIKIWQNLIWWNDSTYVAIYCIEGNFGGSKFGEYMWLSERKQPSLHNYKYLEIPIWNIQLNISQEGKEVLAWISPLIYSCTLSFSWQTLQRTASWIAHHFR